MITYQSEPGKPAPTPDEIFCLLGLASVDRRDLWKLFTHFASPTANLVIVGALSDLNGTQFEMVLVLRICAAQPLSIHIRSTKRQLVAAEVDADRERVYQTTSDFAELAARLLALQSLP